MGGELSGRKICRDTDLWGQQNGLPRLPACDTAGTRGCRCTAVHCWRENPPPLAGSHHLIRTNTASRILYIDLYYNDLYYIDLSILSNTASLILYIHLYYNDLYGKWCKNYIRDKTLSCKNKRIVDLYKMLYCTRKKVY